MALPRSLSHGLTPAEIEFLAENEMIEILPNFRVDTLDFISGSCGPFRPPGKTKTPLWLALALKKQQKCTIIPPSWLTVENLSQRLEEEESEGQFSELPYRYMEIAHLILESASEDVPRSENVRKLLKDLREVRQSKAREGLTALNPDYLQMDNLGLMEINEIRPFFGRAFDELRKLTPVEDPYASQSQDTYSNTGRSRSRSNFSQ
ncbi:GINS complex, PSF2 component [Basidiobolus meristosporus CBS 931.73]|uniref:DNA replication complex GINS protein PSF2 n=1 Tax=Basidiobolus meristosporus CBS 931.73 TaxID=1314790 RepID=A0A1Y1YF22_9FUNG|nr:GINS complex, PSF2 component [Basidiobolus meristosporus CBS 931.73]|eukprot:ORX96194.1 GINS complex, PSF2 component [Basidiobolus meristosporus CBS 931.73]